ncbi:hypothetical protein VKT23_002327 [Stygiomarasmius scandens]|uniref:WKF domain-containing protein n=1 Tax=Marasmiellus scandens TaxID=2682957 RepID=A0ABR1K7Q4_9AGAR
MDDIDHDQREQPSTSKNKEKPNANVSHPKKKKDLDEAGDQLDEESTLRKKKGKKKEKEREKKREGESKNDFSEVSADKKSKKKRKKSEAEVGDAAVTDGLSSGSTITKSGKKRKRDRNTDDSSTHIDETVEEPKRKKSKNKTGLSDPSDDSSLSDQARKALEYAFTQFRRPKKWKFHKARQNWIIRNVWSSTNVPDSQLPLVLRYLANVQGGVRENLVKTCQNILESSADAGQADTTIPNAVPTDETKSQAEKPNAEPKTDETKLKRATALLEVLTKPQESVVSTE